MNDRTIFGKAVSAIPSQKQKRSNATQKPTQGCFTLAFTQPHQRPLSISIFSNQSFDKWYYSRLTSNSMIFQTTGGLAKDDSGWFDVAESYYIMGYTKDTCDYSAWKKIPLVESKAFSFEASFRFISGYEKNGYGFLCGQKSTVN